MSSQVDLLEKLAEFESRMDELSDRLSDPVVLRDPKQNRVLGQEFARVREIVERYRAHKNLLNELGGAQELLSEETDPEILEMARAEVGELKARVEGSENELKLLLLPPDPNDQKNTLVEVRAGTGGEEASLFAADLFRMYSRYADRCGWRIEVMTTTGTDKGGFREIIFAVEGKEVFSRLKFESGTHRVQRVPVTEASGRIHTSAATVAVLPEAEEVDIKIDPAELRIDVYRSSGPGGQSVNTTDSAVRVTHVPTGVVVTCQDEKSQHKNRDKALKVLRARLQDKFEREQHQEIAAARKAMVGSGDRSERIRTYNFPQGRVTDHRINLTLYKLAEVVEGDLGEIIEALQNADRIERLRALGAG